MIYWQSPLLFCGLFDFFAVWLASDVSKRRLRLQVNCDLVTFGDTLRDGSRLASEHLPLIIHAKHLSFTFTGNV